MPDLVLGSPRDRVVIRPVLGDQATIEWCADVDFYGPLRTVLLPRMPITANERAWLYLRLTAALAPGGSVRFVGPSLHA